MQASPSATLVQLEEQMDPFLLPPSLISGVVSSSMVSCINQDESASTTLVIDYRKL